MQNVNQFLGNISKTSASVSSGFPNTRKQMKARGCWPSAFIVFECLETPMKQEAQVFEIASQSKLKLRSRTEIKSLKSLLIDLFSLYVLLPHFRPRDVP